MKLTDLANTKEYEIIMEELMLGDQLGPDNAPVFVKVFRHLVSRKGIQIDVKNSRYREASQVLGEYGVWKPLQK